MQETPDPKAEPRVNISTVQSRLWREAYDEVKKTNPKLVDAYESILSANWRDVQQPDSDPSGPPLEPVGDDLSDNPEVRRRQMHELIQDGLNRTERQASVMEHLSEATEFLRSVGDIVQAAVSGSSEAALAWVPVSMGLEVCRFPFVSRRQAVC